MHLESRDFGSEKVIIVRHDLDFNLESAIRMASVDFELGVKSTFFLRVCARGYNILSYEGLNFINQLKEMDMEIGLHADIGMEGVMKTNARDALLRQLSALESAYGQPLLGISAHAPATLGGINLCDELVNSGHITYHAYEKKFTSQPFKYLSDSMRIWREGDPYEVGKNFEAIQLLTHPIWWHQTAPQENY